VKSKKTILFKSGKNENGAVKTLTMKVFTRRRFVKISTFAITAQSFNGSTLAMSKKIHHLSFSTLGCPSWTLSEILTFAELNGYDGIEIRGILGELDLTKCQDFNSKNKIVSVKKIAADKNLKIVDLGSSAQLHHVDQGIRKNNLDNAKKFIDLAEELNCPYIRVFPDMLPKTQEREATIDLIINGLNELADYAKGSNVSVLLESHGDGVESDELLHIMQSTESPHTGMVWDICNMWYVTKEPPAFVYNRLKKYIKHTHFKDLKVINGTEHYVLLGQGEVPNREAVQSLEQGNYSGYYSFEWEKLWHPDIEAPEIALAQFPIEMKKYFKT
jgi:sugar phosphate isomerase/epimerase